MNRWRSEKCERSFAHVCETGGGRRMWLRGLVNASKSHLMRCAGFNLGLILRKCYGLSKPRSAAGAASVFFILGLLLTPRITGLGLSPSQVLFRLWAVIVLLLSAWAPGISNHRYLRVPERTCS